MNGFHVVLSDPSFIHWVVKNNACTCLSYWLFCTFDNLFSFCNVVVVVDISGFSHHALYHSVSGGLDESALFLVLYLMPLSVCIFRYMWLCYDIMRHQFFTSTAHNLWEPVDGGGQLDGQRQWQRDQESGGVRMVTKERQRKTRGRSQRAGESETIGVMNAPCNI